MNKIQRLRTLAYRAQGGRCCYCGVPMWVSSPKELLPIGIGPRAAKLLQCTAEHLVARQDGGQNVAGNIAAACVICNQRRHRRRVPPSPDTYRELVKGRIARGKWQPAVVLIASQQIGPNPTSSIDIIKLPEK